VGRLAALYANYPIEVPGIQINRMCGSGTVTAGCSKLGTGADNITYCRARRPASGSFRVSGNCVR